MAIFIDSGNIEEIKTYHAMGIIRGVTTNPTILLKDGITGGKTQIKSCAVEVAKLIRPYPLSVEVTTNDPESMLAEALEMSSWADNINVKLTIHGPNGELDNLSVIHELETKHDVRVNVTAMMSAQQCF
jgi:transaldolase